MKDVTVVIYENLDKLSSTQRKIGQFFLDNIEEIPFYTAAEISKKLSLSEATIVRFAQNIGFKGYPDLKKHILEYSKEKITPSKKMRKTLKQVDSNDINQILVQSLNIDIENINNIIPKLVPEYFEKVVNEINEANRIYLIGIGVSQSLVSFMEFRLKRLKKDVKSITKGGKGFIDEILDFRKDDIIIVFGFHRPAKELFIALDYALQCKTKTIAITNDVASLLGEKAEYVIPAKRGPVGVLNSLVVPMSICHAITVGLASLSKDNSVSSSDILEELWEKYFI